MSDVAYMENLKCPKIRTRVQKNMSLLSDSQHYPIRSKADLEEAYLRIVRNRELSSSLRKLQQSYCCNPISKKKKKKGVERRKRRGW